MAERNFPQRVEEEHVAGHLNFRSGHPERAQRLTVSIRGSNAQRQHETNPPYINLIHFLLFDNMKEKMLPFPLVLSSSLNIYLTFIIASPLSEYFKFRYCKYKNLSKSFQVKKVFAIFLVFKRIIL